MLEQRQHTLTIATRGPGFTDLAGRVSAWLASIGAGDGLLTLFVRHTSASLTIQENADPDVLRDLPPHSTGWPRAAPPTPTTSRAPTTCRPTSGRC